MEGVLDSESLEMQIEDLKKAVSDYTCRASGQDLQTLYGSNLVKKRLSYKALKIAQTSSRTLNGVFNRMTKMIDGGKSQGPLLSFWNLRDQKQIRSSSGGKFGLQDFNRPCGSSENEARISCDPPAKLFTSDQNKMEKRIKRTLFGIEISESDISSSAMTSQSDAAISESSPNWTIPPSSLSKNLTSIQVSTSVNTSTQSNRASLLDATKP
ncbi:hypothetical protein DVH24_037044 [Malus domestica]|uniref:Uncharacterized protein n=1 Tax=Malus domestica TaxID=3750 RepID=A0A498HEP6_MALDO|nr:hypothetical protein DVH24_037044 [Malus domestica]